VEAAPETTQSGPGTIQVGDFQIQSGQASQEQLEEQFREEIEADTKEAASKLGKKGAKARKEKASQEEGTEEAAEPPEPKAKPKGEVNEKEASSSEPEEEAEESEEKSEDADKAKKLGNPKHDPRARMLAATRQLAEERRAHQETRSQIDELRAELEAIKTGRTEARTEPKAAPRGDGPQKPDPDQFGTLRSTSTPATSGTRRGGRRSLRMRTSAAPH